jgi:hypothetical protein
VKVLDHLTSALAPATKTSEHVENELKSHMEKLKSIIGKTSMQQNTELEIKKTKQDADLKIKKEEIKADKEVTELKDRVNQA